MFMRSFSLKSITNRLTDNSVMFFMVLSFLSFYFNVPGIFRQVLWILLFLLNLKNVTIISQIDKLVVFYFFVSFLTLSGYTIIPYPLTDFIKVFIYSYVPIIFYFVGKNNSLIYPKFIEKANWGIMLLFLIGFYFLLFPSETYIAKSLETINIHGYYTENTLMFARFASFMDSYHTANLGVCSLCFSFGLLNYTDCTKLNRSKLLKILSYVFILASAIGILLARQRVAMYIGVLIFLYYLFFRAKGRIAIIAIVISLCIFVIIIFSNVVDSLFFEQIASSFSSSRTSTLFSSRTNQWMKALNGFLMAPLLGLGIGSSGHVAYVSNPTHPLVTDGSYFKILVEGGLVSFIPFMIILIASLFKSFKYRKKYYVEFPLLFFFACSLLGANIIDMPYIIMFMWYIIGRINSNKQFTYDNVSLGMSSIDCCLAK